MSSRLLSTARGINQEAFTALDWGLFLSIGLIWGSSFLLIAIGLEAFEPGLITWLRVCAGALVLALVPSARRPIEAGDRSRVVAMSVLWVAIPFTLFPLAQQWVTSAVAGMLNGALPIITAAIGALMLRRLPTPAQIVGLVLGTAGIAAIALSAASEGTSAAVGVAMLVVAVGCYGLAVNISTPIVQRYGALPVMARMLALAVVWTAPYGLWSIPGSTFEVGSLAAVLVLGAVGTGLAFVFMGRLVARVGSTRAAFATYLVPVVALMLGIVARNEPVTVIALIGIAMVIAGAILASRRESTVPAAPAT